MSACRAESRGFKSHLSRVIYYSIQMRPAITRDQIRRTKRAKLHYKTQVLNRKLLAFNIQRHGKMQRVFEELGRNGRATKLRNRCMLTGRPRRARKRYGLARQTMLEFTRKGRVSGVRRATWLFNKLI